MNEETHNSTHEEANAPHETRESLWLLTFGPATWAAHFTLCYVTAAIWCAKVAGRLGPLDGARIAIGIYTLLALSLIIITARRGWRRAHFGSGKLPHDMDTSADRHRFLGFATLLLCGLSAVATVYVALAAVVVGSCR